MGGEEGAQQYYTAVCPEYYIKPTELPGKMRPLLPSGTIILEMTKCFLIGLEAHCTRRNTYLVLKSGQKTTHVEVTASEGNLP